MSQFLVAVVAGQDCCLVPWVLVALTAPLVAFLLGYLVPAMRRRIDHLTDRQYTLQREVESARTEATVRAIYDLAAAFRELREVLAGRPGRPH